MQSDKLMCMYVGFASLDHLPHLEPASLTTRPLAWAVAATHLFVNFEGKNLTAALLDAATRQAIAPFTLENSVPLDASDSTRSAMAWRGQPGDGIAQLRGRSVRIVFRWGGRETGGAEAEAGGGAIEPVFILGGSQQMWSQPWVRRWWWPGDRR